MSESCAAPPMENPIEPCKCGSVIYWKNLRCGGWWSQLIGPEGIEDTNLDSMWYGKEPKTVTCSECNRVRPNPNYIS